MLQPNPKIVLLVVAHFVGLTVLAFLSESDLSDWRDHAAFILSASQFSLLTIFVGFGPEPLSRRIGYGVAGLLLILVLSAPFSSVASMTWSINRVARCVAGCAVLSFVRYRTTRIAHESAEGTENLGRFQFRLWQLLATGMATTVVVWVGQRVHGFFDRPMESILASQFLFVASNLIFFAVGLIYSLTIAFVSLWATLAVKRPIVPIFFAIAIACAISPLWPFLSQQRADSYTIQAMVTGCQTAIVIASLLVVRLCGYRMVRAHDDSKDDPSIVSDVPVP